MTGMWIVAFVLQWVLLLLLTVLLIGVLRYLGLVQKNIHLVTRYASRFEEGDHINHFELADLEGLPVVSKALLSQSKKTLLFFLTPGCSGCKAVISQIANLARAEGGLKKFGWSFVLIYTGSPAQVKAQVAPIPLGEATILVDEEGTLHRQYDIRAFPVAIAADEQGKVLRQKLGKDIESWLFTLLNAPEAPMKSHPLPININLHSIS